MTKRRLTSLAINLGEYSVSVLGRDEILNKMQKSRRFSTETLLAFLTMRELMTVARRVGVSPKARAKSALADRILVSMASHKKKVRQASVQPKKKSQPRQKVKPKTVLEIRAVVGRDPQADFVFCPICEREVTFFHLPQHLERSHPELEHYDVKLDRKGAGPSRSRAIVASSKSKSSKRRKSASLSKTSKTSLDFAELSPQAKKAMKAAETAEAYARGSKIKKGVKLKGYVKKSGKPYTSKPPRPKVVSGGLPSLGKRR